MTFHRLLGDLLRLDDVRDIAGWQIAFAASWAARHPLRVIAVCAACVAAAGWFYLRRQPAMRRGTRLPLTALRGAMLSLLVVLLADPVLQIAVRHGPRPTLWLLFDGTESMAIKDDIAEPHRAALAAATGIDTKAMANGTNAEGRPSRQDFVAGWVRRQGGAIEKLAQTFRLRAYVLESPASVRPLETGADADGGFDRDAVATQLTTSGRVTALGQGFEDLTQRQGVANLQGLVVISDFDQNSGPPAAEAARRLGVPVHTVGVGPASAIDLAVDLLVPPMMKKAEQSGVTVTLRQTGLEGETATVTVTARSLGGPADGGAPFRVGTRTVPLAGPTTAVTIPFTPQAIGRHEFVAEATPVTGEVVEDNNRSAREANIRDDYLRLMYVEYEPTWEWRFVKEVFHRDPLVGMRGFRTFLRSADPLVRKTNELFLPTATPPRREFFATDVIFLGDMPGQTISGRFCELTREFVETFGGGLVVIAGSRFGPGQLVGTPLADMLPVVVEGESRPRMHRPFALKLTPDAALVEFMQLGGTPQESQKAWANLGELPWYQPAVRPHPQATVLATHPTDTCADGRTPQPLIAIRRFGRGEVVYLAFNETWRLRRAYGERYYRQFWGQMIYRLGLSHALGEQKRFVVRTDAARYQSEDTALVTVEAYDANFEPLAEEALPNRAIMARLFRPDRGGAAETVALPQARRGVFEARLPLAEAGDYRLRVADPLTREESEVVFSVTALSAERRSAVRNVAVQKAIAAETLGLACDLVEADRVLGDISPSARVEKSVKVVPLGMTWLCLGLGLFLMITEWALRKGANLT